MKNQNVFVRRILAIVLCLAMVLPYIPLSAEAFSSGNVDNYSATAGLKGLTLSVLGDSISTYANVSSGTAANTTNSTIGSNAVYYTAGNAYGVTQPDTWWQQTADAMGMKVLVNNSWSGSCVFKTRSGTVGAYVDRCVQLHDNTGSNSGEEPDLVAIYLGTNDVDKEQATVGTISDVVYSKIEKSGFTPTTATQAYALMLYKAMKRYDEAEFYCFTLVPERNGQTADQMQTMLEYNEAVKSIAKHYGAYVVDLFNDSGFTTDSLTLNHYLANNLHPNAAGMDAIANCLISSILKNSKHVSSGAKVQSVSYDLNNVCVKQGTIQAAINGQPFEVDLLVKKGFTPKATVTMGGKDITAQCCKNGTISIASVTGDVKITASAGLDDKNPKIYRWELTNNALMTVNDGGASYNYATLTAGSCTGSVFSKAQHVLDEAVILFHDRPWVVEWKSKGAWTSGSLLLTGSENGKTAGSTHIFRRPGSSLIAVGYSDGTSYYNYGLDLSDHGIDGTASHTYRLVNEIAADGSNMVYLHVDGKKLGAMNNYYLGSSDKNTTSNWLNGQDLMFTHMGSSGHPINDCTINHIQIWENGIPVETELHNYRWEPKSGKMTSITTGDFTENNAVIKAGSINSSGKFTGTYFTLDESVVLLHDKPWSIEWKSKGSWKDAANGGMLLVASDKTNAPNGAYLYRRCNSEVIAFGERTSSHDNYGISLADHGIDGTAEHVYRLTNRVNANGSNMVYLYVDGVELGAMNNYFVGGTAQGKTSNWVSGRDFTFDYMGTSQFPIGNCYLNYLQIWENGIESSDYRWEMQNNKLVSVTTDGFAQNGLTTVSGSISGGKLTASQFKLQENVTLRHDKAWSVEWKSKGSWKDTANGALLFATDPTSTTDGTVYLYRRNASTFIALGERSGGKHMNYGVSLADHGIDGSAEHVYRLTNRIAADGSNMVYLFVDGVELGAMNNCFVGGTAQGTTSNWVSGRDFVFSYMGTTDFPIGNCYIDYIQVWEDKAEPNDYRWETQNDVLTSITTDGFTQNNTTTMMGSITDGVYTDSQFKLDQSIVLLHDRPWSMEWKAAGNWNSSTGGALLFSSTQESPVDGGKFIFSRKNGTLLALGITEGNKYHNYGVKLTDYGIDYNASHVYRLTNRVYANGSNMVYLYVDGVEISAMNQYFLGGTAQNTTSDALSGEDFVFSYMGVASHLIGNCSIDYIQVWEDGISKENYRWETQNDVFVDVTTDGNAENEATLLSGSITGGKFSGVHYSLENPVTLRHDDPWAIEWQSTGTWKDAQNGAMLFSSHPVKGTEGMSFLYRRNASDFIALGQCVSGVYQNYGIRLSDYGIDGSKDHVYLLANRLNADGSNMVYLFVDGKEVGPLNNYYQGGTDKYTKSNWISGKDFTFHYMGNDSFFIGNCSIDYLQVWEGGAPPATVEFQNWDGTVLSSQQYLYGEKVAAPTEIPTRPTDKAASYTFAGWDKEVGACTGDVVYTATYTPEYIDYAVEFQDYDGLLLSNNSYHYGDPIIAPDAPTRAADETYTYTFAGWDKEVTVCTGDMEFVATYEATYIDYTVQFVDEDGTVISTATYHYGDTVEVPEDPSKEADETYTYSFAGWDKEVVACGGDAVYTATYTATNIEYVVQFVDEDGTVISSNTYHYGDAVTVPEDPTKESDDIYTYTFAGWDKEVVACGGDAVYTATYTTEYREYTVVFRDWDGSTIFNTGCRYGETIVAPADPTREADETYTYTFTGWDKEITACTDDMEFVATYEATYIDYVVQFVDEDGTVISTATYHYGDTVEVPADPSKEADETYTYTFAGWDKEVTVCTGDMEFVATYEATYIDYTVQFVDEDGTVISTATYHYGDTVEVPADPSKEADETYTYTFAGWDKEVVACGGDAVYTATYTATNIEYVVQFVDEDGTVISSNTYHYGDAVTVPEDPTKESDDVYTYTFAGWDKEVVACGGDAVYTATYTSQYIDYTVTFRDWDGTVLNTATYHYGDEVTVPADPAREADETYTYAFAGWDKEVANCAGDAEYTATYDATRIEVPVVEDSKDIKWQVTSGTNADSASTNLRLLTWVDTLEDYSSVSFNVTINGKTTKLECTTVYTAILASGVAIRNPANVFKNESANYFVTYTLKNIPSSSFDTPIVVTVTWTDLWGNETTSESKTIVISSDWA